MFNSSSILCVFFLKKISYWFSKVMIEKRHLTKYLTVCSSFIRARLTFCCSCFCKISSLFLYFCLSCLFVKLNQAIILSHWSCELVRWGCWGTANLLIPVLYFANVVRLWFPHKWYISTNSDWHNTAHRLVHISGFQEDFGQRTTAFSPLTSSKLASSFTAHKSAVGQSQAIWCSKNLR